MAQAVSQVTRLGLDISQIFRSKPLRLVGTVMVTCILIFVLYGSTWKLSTLSLGYSHCLSQNSSSDHSLDHDWTQYAYTQYVTNTPYLCNSIMLFETLHRLGSKADRLILYPSGMDVDPSSHSIESRLLLKAQNEYGVKLMPIEIQHREGRDCK